MELKTAFVKGCQMAEAALRELNDGNKGVYLVVAYGKQKDDFSKELIIFERAIGTPDSECKQVAMDKAEIVWETGVSGDVVARHNPLYLLSRGKTCLWEGSATRIMGKIAIVVSVSGSTSLRDKFIAEVFLSRAELFLSEKAKKSVDGDHGYLKVNRDQD